MSLDRRLTTVLGLYQNVHDAAKTQQILGTTASLLTALTNPLNISLLTSHFLTATAVWNSSSNSSSRTCLQVMSVFSTAAMRVHRSEVDGTLSRTIHGSEGWARAVARGADERSARWQHLLALAGVLVGLEGGDSQSLPPAMRRTLEEAVARAASMALVEAREQPHLATTIHAAVAVALAHTFRLLSGPAMRSIAADALAPAMLDAMLGPEGLQNGSFIGGLVNQDVLDQPGSQGELLLHWPQTSPSFAHMTHILSQPLVGLLGPLSRLIAHAVDYAKSTEAVFQVQDRMLSFSREFLQHWRANRLSQLESSGEPQRLSPQTLQNTWPSMLQTQKNIFFASISVLQAVVSRSLVDHRIAGHRVVAAATASKTLHILRNLCFISSRPGNSAFQAYAFTHLGAIDILTKDGDACVDLLRQMLPPSSSIGRVPSHALDRALDLFYLTLAEHSTLSLGPEACETLIVRPAMVYLSSLPQQQQTSPSPGMVELYEAAHSAMLSVLCCPQNAPLTAAIVPVYTETLFHSFPHRISARQFRMATKTIMQIISPPFPISSTHPDLAETLLEMVCLRADTSAGTTPLPSGTEGGAASGPVSEQSALVLALVDCLPYLPLAAVEEWMTVAAISLNKIADAPIRDVVKQRFWDVLVSGEMDVERAAIGVAWWGTKGGRELVLFGPAQGPTADPMLMSGAIVDGGERDSKL